MNNEMKICLRCNTIAPMANDTCTQCHIPLGTMVGLDHFIDNQFPTQDGLYMIDGTIIGERYQISGFIGKGHRWKIYSAKDLHQSKPVALKIKTVGAGIDQKLHNLKFKASLSKNRRYITCDPDFRFSTGAVARCNTSWSFPWRLLTVVHSKSG